MSKKLTTEEFIAKAKLVHGNKYDYSKVEYSSEKTKVCIVCPIHGEFWQRPNDHLSGYGCYKCAHGCYGTEGFISKAKLVHSNKYDYSKVEYSEKRSKVCIICPEHGEFWQQAGSHLEGAGCPHCAVQSRKLTTEEFIAKAKLVHGDKYDYSKVEYITSNNKISIVCPTHGEFCQTPSSHLAGQGCPICRESKGEQKIRVWLENNHFVKDKDYIMQYHSDWLNRQSLDFFFPKINLGIEYDGGQHFHPVKRFGGDEQFIRQKERDKEKNILCKENNVRLLRISYRKYNSIENILKEELLNEI